VPPSAPPLPLLPTNAARVSLPLLLPQQQLLLLLLMRAPRHCMVVSAAGCGVNGGPGGLEFLTQGIVTPVITFE
jgi:hypothetical protein